MNETIAELLPGPLRNLRTTALKICQERYGEEWIGLFRGLISSFAGWVWDLPASERSHHVYPFGLLAHSLDVMARAARISTTIYGPCLGLLHDCGRVFDLQITGESDGELWDPLTESLLVYSRRGPCRVAWQPGRGLVRHEKAGLSLLQIMLPVSLKAELGPLLESTYIAYCRRHDPSAPMYDDELWDLVGLVHQADCQSAAAGRMQIPKREPGGTQGLLGRKASKTQASVKAGGTLEKKRGVYANPSGSRTRTGQNAQDAPERA